MEQFQTTLDRRSWGYQGRIPGFPKHFNFTAHFLRRLSERYGCSLDRLLRALSNATLIALDRDGHYVFTVMVPGCRSPIVAVAKYPNDFDDGVCLSTALPPDSRIRPPYFQVRRQSFLQAMNGDRPHSRGC